MVDTRPTSSEKTILVGLERDGVTRWDVEDSLDELRLLAATAGAQVIDTFLGAVSAAETFSGAKGRPPGLRVPVVDAVGAARAWLIACTSNE